MSAPTDNTTLSSTSTDICGVCTEGMGALQCSCGNKFHFRCINFHIQQLRSEFDYVHVKIGERLLQIKEIMDTNDCDVAKNVLISWVRITF